MPDQCNVVALTCLDLCNAKLGVRSPGSSSKSLSEQSSSEIPEEEGWTVSNCPPFMCNKKLLSKECAVTNGAGAVPGIYLLDRTLIAVTGSKGSNAQLYWPFHIDETCQSVLVSPIAFGATSVPGPKDLKSP